MRNAKRKKRSFILTLSFFSLKKHNIIIQQFSFRWIFILNFYYLFMEHEIYLMRGTLVQMSDVTMQHTAIMYLMFFSWRWWQKAFLGYEWILIHVDG
ncbi:hypothetical protein HDV63DRAFT_299410 [Trichoderma sp. SZMC 28014]